MNLAKEKDCALAGEWIKSIINHLYWCASSTPDGNGDVMEAKWLSVVNHIRNRHTQHDRLFPKCLHAKYKRRRGEAVKWMKQGETWQKLLNYQFHTPIQWYCSTRALKIVIVLQLAGTKAYEGVYAILTAKALVADVRKLSTQHQTSNVEVYHSVVIHFAPKLLVFSYEGMVCRYMLYTILCLNHSLWCINIILLSIHQANLSSFAFQREQQPLTSTEES